LTPEFVGEDDLGSFEGWLKYQAAGEATPKELEQLRAIYERAREISLATPKVGLMKFKPGEHRYAVAVCNASDLWLTLWVKRNPKGEFFVFQPRSDTDWNPHTSYHLDGTLHWKTFACWRQKREGIMRHLLTAFLALRAIGMADRCGNKWHDSDLFGAAPGSASSEICWRPPSRRPF
jgi:hypothetical protein